MPQLEAALVKDRARVLNVFPATLAIAMSLSGCLESRLSTANLRETNAFTRREMAEFSNRVVLENILRAREFAPLNYSDLSSMSNTSSAQSTLNFTVPFGPLGPYHNPMSAGRASVAPGEMLSTSPTASISSLNEQGFVLAMMQPINPMFVASKWNAGYDHELLFKMFVKSIQFPGGQVIVNNPDDYGNYYTFLSVERQLLQQASLHVVTVMEPLGTPIHFSTNLLSKIYRGSSVQVAAGHPTQEDDFTYDATSVATLAQSLGEAQLHLGNDGCRRGESNCSIGESSRLFREYPQQVVLCSRLPAVPVATYQQDNQGNISVSSAIPFNIYGVSDVAPEEAAAGAVSAAAGPVAAMGHPPSNPAAATAGAAPTGATSAAAGQTSTPSTTITAALAANRIGAVIYQTDCQVDELIRKPQSEHDFASSTAKITRIEWRSAAEVIDYLGALARTKVNPGDSGLVPLRFVVVPTDFEDDSGYVITAGYRGKHYGISDTQSLQALRILRELIDVSKIGASASIPQPILFVP